MEKGGADRRKMWDDRRREGIEEREREGNSKLRPLLHVRIKI